MAQHEQNAKIRNRERRGIPNFISHDFQLQLESHDQRLKSSEDYSFHDIQAQVHLRPKLTVNPAVITETDSVTLNCQTPPSVSVTQCYFYTLSGGTIRVLSCLQTLTGTELLKMAHQSSPATVGLQCYYKAMNGEKTSWSLHSNTSSITIQTIPPPKLTVDPPVITETDSVTLNCQTPPSVSVTQCYFYTLSGGTIRVLSCLQTLTGTELLQMAHQRSPAEIKVKCYYTVKREETNSPSPHSDTTSIMIQSAAENNERKTDLTTSISTTTSPVGGGDEGQTANRATTPVTLVKLASDQSSVQPDNIVGLTSTSLTSVKATSETVTADINLSAKGSMTTAVETPLNVTSGDNNTDSFHDIQAQVHLRPKLTVNPPVITETDSVTLNCQTPPSVSVTQCYFYTLSGGTIRVLSCLQTLTGTELLKMAHQSSPATVGLQCYYKAMNGEKTSWSLHSNTSSITIQTIPPPKLTVDPPVITETDSVTLNCQTPPSVSVTQCYFYTLSGGTIRVLSCLQTLTGTELLQMAHQRSPAEIKVKCYYTVKREETNSPSPHSDTTSIMIQSAAENNERKTDLTTSISTTTSPVGGGDEGQTANRATTPVTLVKLASDQSSVQPDNIVGLTSTSLTSVKATSETVTADINLSAKGSMTTAVETPLNVTSGDNNTGEQEKQLLLILI
ncbi:mucin-2-like [Scomber scombrus]|uniref:mucin-2-like n=1 Tax=Scomber scombrus TaxID=13677 RepID=UPI002DDB5C1D|nr:mucin-2-like [Scomber scombrus]